MKCITPLCVFAALVFFIGCGGSKDSGRSSQPPAGDFSISLSPNVVNQQAGESGSPVNLTVSSKNGFSGSVTVSISGLPAGVTTSPAFPVAVAAGANQAVTFDVPAGIAPGSFQATISGASGTLKHSTALALNVSAPKDFNLSVSPNVVIQQAGQGGSPFNVLVGSENGFSGSVTVSISGLPAGVTTSPAFPIAVAAGSLQPVTFDIPPGIAPGNFQASFSGTSGTLIHSTALALNVTAARDFDLSVSPEQIVARAGSASASFLISITGQNGFTGNVTVSLSGLPVGFTSQPSSPFSVAAGQSRTVAISVPASAVVSTLSVPITVTSGALSHSSAVDITVMSIKTFDDGDGMLYLETAIPAETARIGLQKSWGGSIVEASLNGTDYVNNDDPGRQIQTSLWDGNASYSSTWGYNPIEAGDQFFDGSPLLTFSLQADSIYTKTQPIQWAPENFGGGWGSPALGDAYIEKWISVLPNYTRFFKVHYKITHFGNDSHADAPQELPVVYVNPIVSNFLYYAGDAPWTNDSLTHFTMPWSCCPQLYTPEQWGAYVDDSNVGLTLYTPMQYPDSKGFNAGSTLQFTPLCPFSWDSGSVLEFDTYILLGPVDESRAAVYALHSQQTDSSPLPPFGYLDTPANGATLTGMADVWGWAWSLAPPNIVDVFVDGERVGTASSGLPKDISGVFPGSPNNVGYHYSLDTSTLSNGAHTILVKATDANGRVATYRSAPVTVSN